MKLKYHIICNTYVHFHCDKCFCPSMYFDNIDIPKAYISHNCINIICKYDNMKILHVSLSNYLEHDLL